MATLNCNLYSNVGTTPVEILSTDSSKIITILGLNLCNKSNAYAYVDGYFIRGGNSFFVFKNLAVEPETTVVAIGDNQRLILNNNTAMYIRSTSNSSIDVIASVAQS